jgi:DNA-directed RNA polymerase specialized sigma24 family protein
MPEDHGKLLKFAEFTAMKFNGRVNDSNGEDLYQEALLRTLDEQKPRAWYPDNVDFITFLRGCIRSIADQWYKRSRYTELRDEIPSPTRYHEQVEAAITIDEIRQLLKSRPHAVEIFDLKCLRLTGKEIQEALGISPPIYAAAVKWIARALRQGGYRSERATEEPRKPLARGAIGECVRQPCR